MKIKTYVFLQCIPLLVIFLIWLFLILETNEWSQLGVFLMSVIFLLWIPIIIIRNLLLKTTKLKEEASKYSGIKLPSPFLVTFICFISIFVLDLLYPWLFRHFGKNRFIYPSLLSFVGIIGSKFWFAKGGDALEFGVLVVAPIYILIHCIGWFHLNMVNYQIMRNTKLASN